MEPSILVVDDAMFMRRVIRKALSQGGYKDITEAGNGEEALEKYRRSRPDLVLLDITMPGKSGLEVLKDLLNEDETARVIMCSAVGQEPIMTRAIRAGAFNYINKPFQTEKLLAMVEEGLRDV